MVLANPTYFTLLTSDPPSESYQTPNSYIVYACRCYVCHIRLSAAVFLCIVMSLGPLPEYPHTAMMHNQRKDA